MLYVGIDWASDHHDVCLTNDSAQTLAAFRIAHGSEGFERLHHVIKEHQPEPQQVLVALETTRRTGCLRLWSSTRNRSPRLRCCFLPRYTVIEIQLITL